jgi:excisionase family DNA binding protein
MAKKGDQHEAGPPGRNPEPIRPPEVSSQEPLMTTREMMEFLQISRTKLWELVTREGLPAFKIGGDYRYRRAEVLAWLERYRVSHHEKKEQ